MGCNEYRWVLRKYPHGFYVQQFIFIRNRLKCIHVEVSLLYTNIPNHVVLVFCSKLKWEMDKDRERKQKYERRVKLMIWIAWISLYIQWNMNKSFSKWNFFYNSFHIERKWILHFSWIKIFHSFFFCTDSSLINPNT